MSPAELAAIRARVEAASPGEWRARRHGKNFSITSGLPGSMLVVCDVFDDTPVMGGTAGGPDADFIAAAREDVPRLLAEVERLRKVLTNLVDVVRDAEAPLLSACVMSGIHGAPYSGPQWGRQLTAAREALADGPPVALAAPLSHEVAKDGP